MRSQNRENLINNPLRIHYEIGYNEEHRIYANTYDEQILMGTYKTKQRALQILDEIQEAQLGNFHYRHPNNVKVSSKEDTIIYEMPKE